MVFTQTHHVVPYCYSWENIGEHFENPLGKLRELDVNVMGFFWELGEFGGNTLKTSKFLT
jgi:hypothetical protein